MADLNENRPGQSAEALAKAGYKKTKVGWIPEEWDIIKLSSVSSIKRGAGSQYLSYIEKGDDSVRLIRINDFLNNDPRYVEDTEDMKRFRIKEGDILIAGTGATAGITFDVPKEFDGLAFSYNAPRIRMNEDVSKKYIYYFLKCNIIKKQQLSLFTGNAQPFLDIKAIGGFQIALPPLPEQRGIARILSTWDAAIDKLGQLIAKKQALKKGLMQQLLSGRVRFPEFVPPGGTRYKETKVGVVPEDWAVVRIRDVVKEVKRDFSWDDEAKYDLISIRRRSGGVFYRDSLYGHQIKTKTLKPVHEDDFLISKMQIVHGASGLVSSEFDGMMASASYIIMRTKNEDMLDIRFLDLLSRLPWFYHLTYLSSHGVHIEKMTFDFKDFLKRSIYLPPIAEQIRIVECMYSSEREIESLQKEQSYLQTQKKGLMQQLLTGAVRVKEGIANESLIDENP